MMWGIDCDVCGKRHDGECRRGSGLVGELSGDGYDLAVSRVERALDNIRGQRDRDYIARRLDRIAQEIEVSQWRDELRRRYFDHPQLRDRLAYQGPSSLATEPLTASEVRVVLKYRPLARSLAREYSRGNLSEEVVTFSLELLADQFRRYVPSGGVTFDAFAKRFLSGAIRYRLERTPRCDGRPTESAFVRSLTAKPLTAAQAELVLNHRPLARFLAREYSRGNPLVREELETFCLERLTDLARRYDRSRGVPFGAFAGLWDQGAISFTWECKRASPVQRSGVNIH